MALTNRLIPFFIIIVFTLTSCLTVEKKEYKIELEGDHSGILTIKYINIMSVMEDGRDVSDKDYEELTVEYLSGSRPEDKYSPAKVLDKRLFEENGMLCGEVVIEFDDLKQIGIYRHSDGCPYMMCVNPCLENETYASSNGTWGGPDLPVVFWESGFDILTLSTRITVPDETTKSLLNEYAGGQ